MQTIDRHLTVQSPRYSSGSGQPDQHDVVVCLIDELAESADRYDLDDALNYLWRTLLRRLEELLRTAFLLATWPRWGNWLSRANSQHCAQPAYHHNAFLKV